jgi:hypothetical protein
LFERSFEIFDDFLREDMGIGKLVGLSEASGRLRQRPSRLASARSLESPKI